MKSSVLRWKKVCACVCVHGKIYYDVIIIFLFIIFFLLLVVYLRDDVISRTKLSFRHYVNESAPSIILHNNVHDIVRLYDGDDNINNKIIRARVDAIFISLVFTRITLLVYIRV